MGFSRHMKTRLYDRTIVIDRRRSHGSIFCDRLRSSTITIAGSQTIAEVCFPMITDDRRTFCDLRSYGEAILMKMTLICIKMKLHEELIFIWKGSHVGSLEAQENSEMAYSRKYERMENFRNDCCRPWSKSHFTNLCSKLLRIVNAVVALIVDRQ